MPDLLTISLEDYYHVGAFRELIQRGQWSRFESRLELGARRAFALLDEFDRRATFFTQGWVADHFPELVREVALRGHEVASSGYYHRSIENLSPTEVREDLLRAREAIERATGRRVLGFRLPHGWLTPRDLWVLDLLAAEGYVYDSSLAPRLREFGGQPWRRVAHLHSGPDGRSLWEFPIPTVAPLGLSIPIGGGNWLRQLPSWLLRSLIARWHRRWRAPFVLYFHTWELDPDQPRIGAASALTQVRHYRNLKQESALLRYYLSLYRFGSIADHLGLAPTPADLVPAPSARRDDVVARSRSDAGSVEAVAAVGVSVVVPCFNEEESLPYLRNTIASVDAELRPGHVAEWILVDDGSTDRTWTVLHRLFQGVPHVRLLRHERNQGVAAAILTGLEAGRYDIGASVDCDCSYDPHELPRLLALLEPGVDLVTASPYHAAGKVLNVPGWRLVLSRTLSALYRLILHQRLATYTSCFRVYRREALRGIRLDHHGFLGIAELLGVLGARGAVFREYPTTLTVRVLGRSKMRIVRVILGHLGLLTRFARRRLASAIRRQVGLGRAGRAKAHAL